MPFQYLTARRDGPVEYVTLNRPDVRNAFNEVMIGELAAWADSMHAAEGVRAAVLAGAGRMFSAGADLAWMAKMAGYSREENLRDAQMLARMYARLDTMPVPLIGRVHGAALGGGTGLAAVCDVVVASRDCTFGFTEVKLGILPGVISPYVIAKTGRSAARELFLSGARFSAARAREIGLVHAVVEESDLDAEVARYLTEFLTASPRAIAAAKALIPRLLDPRATDIAALTSEAIADLRVSPEGQEGLRAFLERRPAAWCRPAGSGGDGGTGTAS